MSTTNSDQAQLAKTKLGTEIKRLRRDAGLTQAALASQLGYSRVYVTLIENGHDSPGEEFIGLVDQTIGQGDHLKGLFEQVVAANRSLRSGPASEMSIELSRHTLEVVEDSDPELLVLQGQGPKGELCVVRINRREALKKLGSAAAAISLSPGLVGEALAGTSNTSSTPLEHLRMMYRNLIEADNLFGSSYALAGTREQLEIVEHLYANAHGADRKSLVYLRTQLAESIAWLYQDQADHESAWYWTDRGLEWSHVAGSPALTCVVLTRKSQLAGDAGDGATALDYAMAVAELAPTDTRLPAVAQACAAHGYALLGESAASDEAFDMARSLVASTEIDPESAWGGGWLDNAYLDAQQARALSITGRHSGALETFERSLEGLPTGYPRERGVHLARAAGAHSLAGEFEEAATLGQEALKVGQTVKSGRIDNALRSLLNDFESVETEAVSEFRELAHSARVA